MTPTASEASSASVTTLSNGLTIVTETASSTSTVSLTFPNAGSSSETVSEKGAALANKCMAFKSGSGISSAVILRTLENDGATPFASVNRHSATVGFTACPEKAEHLLPLLATTCSYEKWDMKDAIATAKIDVAEAKSNAQVSTFKNLRDTPTPFFLHKDFERLILGNTTSISLRFSKKFKILITI